MATNFKDPRFQEALLQSGAGGPKNQLGLSKQITGDFVGNQIRTKLAFGDLARNKRATEGALKRGYDSLSFQNKWFKQALKDKRQDTNRTFGLGLVTLGPAFLQGKARANDIRAESALRKELMERQIKALKGKEEKK